MNKNIDNTIDDTTDNKPINATDNVLNNMFKKKVFLICGRTASGKDSIANKLAEQGYKLLTSYTTRPRRANEKDTHIFITKEEINGFKKPQDNLDSIIAYTKIGECEYFATMRQLLECDIYIIDPVGIKYLEKLVPQIKEIYNIDLELVTIFISVSEQECFTRALGRSDNREKVVERMVAEYEQFKEFREKEVFYSIPNYNFNLCYSIVERIVEKEMESLHD